MTCIAGVLERFKRAVKGLPRPLLVSSGVCPICEQDVLFVADNPWLRDHFLCNECHSIPRERGLMHAVKTLYPNWRDLKIHESSPGARGASVRFARECTNYIGSQFWPDRVPGETYDGVRCENLEALTFEDDSIDLHISQDVAEHLFHPSRAFKEIARTLRPGGAHIFSVPLVRKSEPSRLRAAVDQKGTIEHLYPPEYHGNPVSEEGALVTVDWGYDICAHIFQSCGLFTQMFVLDDLSKGIRAEYIEILVTMKPTEGSNVIFP